MFWFCVEHGKNSFFSLHWEQSIHPDRRTRALCLHQNFLWFMLTTWITVKRKSRKTKNRWNVNLESRWIDLASASTLKKMEKVLVLVMTSRSCCPAFQSVLAVFKSLSSLDKTVDKCKIRHDFDNSRLIFQLYCKHGAFLIFSLKILFPTPNKKTSDLTLCCFQVSWRRSTSLTSNAKPCKLFSPRIWVQTSCVPKQSKCFFLEK